MAITDDKKIQISDIQNNLNSGKNKSHQAKYDNIPKIPKVNNIINRDKKRNKKIGKGYLHTR